MSIGDFVAIVVTVLVVGALIALAWVLSQLMAVVNELRATLDELNDHTLPAVQELRRTVGTADAELERLHDVIETAESVSTNLVQAGRTAARVAVAPKIKTKAMAAGIRSATDRLRGGKRTR